MNRRGSIIDFFYILAILILIGISVLVAFILINTTSNITVFQEDDNAAKYINYSKMAILSFDNIMLFIIVGLSMFVIISSAVVQNHPVFVIVGLILLAIAIMVAAIVSNTFWAFTNSDIINSAASNFPKMLWLMSKLPIYVLFMGAASIIAGVVGWNKQ